MYRWSYGDDPWQEWNHDEVCAKLLYAVVNGIPERMVWRSQDEVIEQLIKCIIDDRFGCELGDIETMPLSYFGETWQESALVSLKHLTEPLGVRGWMIYQKGRLRTNMLHLKRGLRFRLSSLNPIR